MKRAGRYVAMISGAAAMLGGAAFVAVTKTDAGFSWFLDRMYRSDYADVGLISPEELDGEIRSGAAPVLLDVRAAEEFAVSHLRGALPADPANAAALVDSLRGRFVPGEPIVVYCSVGARSAKLARRLHAAGFTNVRNLYGGLFLWYNQGRAVVRAEREVRAIHPYDFLWGQFITAGGKEYVPGDAVPSR